MGGVQDAVGILDDFREAAANGQGLGGRAARAICDTYAANPVLMAADATANRGALLAAKYGCAPYWEGPDGYDPPTEVPPTLTGGQCDTLYRLIEIVNPDCEGTVENIRFSNVQGPISVGNVTQVSERPDSTEECPKFLWSTPFTSATAQSLNLNSISSTSPVWRAERMDGLPDECGDPPDSGPGVGPGSPPDVPGPGNPRDIGEPGSPFPITIGPPSLGPDGGPWFPIKTPWGEEPVSPTDPNPPGTENPPAIGEPIDVDGNGDVDDDEEDPVTELIGYEVKVRIPSSFTDQIQGTNPRIFPRVVGSVQLKMEDSDGNVFYSENLRITSERSSIVRRDRSLKVVGLYYNVLPELDGLTVAPIRGFRDDS